MGLDPCVKKLLRVETKGAFSYYRSLQELYEKCPMDATVVDVNVELFKKPERGFYFSCFLYKKSAPSHNFSPKISKPEWTGQNGFLITE